MSEELDKTLAIPNLTGERFQIPHRKKLNTRLPEYDYPDKNATKTDFFNRPTWATVPGAVYFDRKYGFMVTVVAKPEGWEPPESAVGPFVHYTTEHSAGETQYVTDVAFYKMFTSEKVTSPSPAPVVSDYVFNKVGGRENYYITTDSDEETKYK